MRLELSGAPEIAAPRERVWERLLDAEFVGKCAPGVRSVKVVDDTHYKVTAGLGVGAVKLTFVLDVELSDLDPPISAKMAARGRAAGSEVRVESSVALETPAANRTRLSWTVAADVHGTVVSVGARLLKGTAGKLADGFWKKFAKAVGRERR
ncbi:MAG: carbon monoxide dehydrogenase subunit G [Gemmatimonadetes bacterium]|nr:carbon monoxide dehydrogenase subunit G [Gemmatimonadota bacterium]